MKLNESRPDQTKADENKQNYIRPDQNQRKENDMESVSSAMSGVLSGLAEKNNFHFLADKAGYPEDEVNYPTFSLLTAPYFSKKGTLQASRTPLKCP